jgi:hypothetical protein
MQAELAQIAIAEPALVCVHRTLCQDDSAFSPHCAGHRCTDFALSQSALQHKPNFGPDRAFPESTKPKQSDSDCLSGPYLEPQLVQALSMQRSVSNISTLAFAPTEMPRKTPRWEPLSVSANCAQYVGSLKVPCSQQDAAEMVCVREKTEFKNRASFAIFEKISKSL